MLPTFLKNIVNQTSALELNLKGGRLMVIKPPNQIWS